MINESEKGFEVPVPGAQGFIPARTLEEAEGVLAGLQGATEKKQSLSAPVDRHRGEMPGILALGGGP